VARPWGFRELLPEVRGDADQPGKSSPISEGGPRMAMDGRR